MLHSARTKVLMQHFICSNVIFFYLERLHSVCYSCFSRSFPSLTVEPDCFGFSYQFGIYCKTAESFAKWIRLTVLGVVTRSCVSFSVFQIYRNCFFSFIYTSHVTYVKWMNQHLTSTDRVWLTAFCYEIVWMREFFRIVQVAFFFLTKN